VALDGPPGGSFQLALTPWSWHEPVFHARFSPLPQIPIHSPILGLWQ